MTSLLLYGLQRSGTNFLETLLKKKYRVRFLNSSAERSSPMHKHFRLYDAKHIIPEPQYRNEIKVASLNDLLLILDGAPDYYLVISKDPYSWFLSYKNWAKQCNWPEVTHHYIAEYNKFYGKWLELARESNKILFIRYLDLLNEKDKELSRLESTMHLKNRFLSYFFSSMINHVPQSEEFSKERRNYYLKEQYLKIYTQEDLKEINNLIDPEVLALLDYQKKEPLS